MDDRKSFTLVIRGRRLDYLHETQRAEIGRMLAAFMKGEDVDLGRLKPYGLDVQVGPAAVINATADFFDDGFHEQLVADLREVTAAGELDDAWPEPIPIDS